MNSKVMLSEKDPSRLVDFGDTLKTMSAKKRMKFRIFKFMEQGMLCHYCKQKMVLDVTHHSNGYRPACNRATFEHLVDDWARIEGKDNSLDKIVLACGKCNNDRNTDRIKKALSYYCGQFSDKKDFHAFCRGAKPRDFIEKFGIWEDKITSEPECDTMLFQ